MASGQQNTLRGWKEIANYVGRDVRTVQRWEARRGFPVTRLPGGERGNVYALASDIDLWLHPSARMEAVADAATATGLAAVAAPLLPAEAWADSASDDFVAADPAFEVPVLGDPVPADVSRRQGSRLAWGLASLAVAAALATFFFLGLHTYRVHSGGAPDPGVPSEHHAVPSAEVDQLYMQGMYLFEKRTSESLVQAKQVLLQATVLDPNNAPAWSGLAQVGTLLFEYGVEADAGAPRRAQAAAERALTLDPTLAEPHAVLGFADFFWDGNVKAAEPEFQTALRLNASSALARSWYGTVLTREGRYPEALEQLNQAQLLQPSSTAILSNRALALGLSGHRDMALDLLEKAGGDTSIANVRFNIAYLSLVRPCNTPVFLREELALSGALHSETSLRLYTAAQDAYRHGGEPAVWRSFLANREAAQLVSPELLAGAYAALGENDAGLDVLATAQRRNGAMMDLSIYPLLQPLHRDPRFRQLLIAEGLPPVP